MEVEHHDHLARRRRKKPSVNGRESEPPLPDFGLPVNISESMTTFLARPGGKTSEGMRE
jgi:hypothetical protein